MNRITEHQVLPKKVVHERIKQRLFRFLYEHNDIEFLDVIASLVEDVTINNDWHGSSALSRLDLYVDQYLRKYDLNDR